MFEGFWANCFRYVHVPLFEPLVNQWFSLDWWVFHVHVIDDRVPPRPPPWMVVVHSNNIDKEPRPPRDPVKRTRNIPAFVGNHRSRPEQRTPVIVVIGIPVSGPPVPVVVIGTMDDGNVARSRLKIYKTHIEYIEAVLSLSHNMHFHRIVLHVAAARDNNGFRGSFGSKDKRISI